MQVKILAIKTIFLNKENREVLQLEEKIGSLDNPKEFYYEKLQELKNFAYMSNKVRSITSLYKKIESATTKVITTSGNFYFWY
ncbi:MAG: hypothetical protein ACTSRG_12950 [Candidatus Helarchaeota archaeon]